MSRHPAAPPSGLISTFRPSRTVRPYPGRGRRCRSVPTVPVWLALLRGINVGGRHQLPMAELRGLLADLGYRSARTYIQSGNAVFAGDDEDGRVVGRRLAGAVEEAKGFRPAVMVLSPELLERTISGNPFPEANAEPKALHAFFLAEEAAGADLDRMEELRSGSERYEVCGDVAYLLVPEGLGRSKLAAGFERALGVEATARNWRTVAKLAAMAAEVAEGAAHRSGR